MNLDRVAFEQVYKALGMARNSLLGAFGDTNKYPGALMRMESALCRLRQATTFHDSDGSSELLAYNTEDPVRFGVMDGILEEQDHDAPEFEEQGVATWYPRYYGPPSPEGWGIWYYNAWSSWDVEPQTGNTEGVNYDDRLTYTRPQRWDGAAHQDVPYFKHARWISLLNEKGSTISPFSWVTFTISADKLDGCMLIDAETDVPRDIRFYAYDELVQTKTGSSWNATTLPSYGDMPVVLDMEVSKTGSNYGITIRVPANVTTWANNSYWHIVVMWGTHEELSLEPISGISGLPAITAIPNVRVWTRKNFFRKDVGVQFGWTLDSIYSAYSFLRAKNRTHFKFYDGEYSDPPVPSLYYLPDWEAATPVGYNGSLTGYLRDLRKGCACCIRLMGRTQKSDYESPDVRPLLSVGPEVTAEFWPENWDECPYFPPEIEGYETLGRIVVIRAPGALYDIVDQRDASFRTLLADIGDVDDANSDEISSLNCHFYIAWMSQDVLSFARPPVEDPDAIERLLFALYLSLLELRLYSIDTPISSLAYGLLPPGAYLPNTILTGLSNLRNENNTSSKAFRAALKTPINSELAPEDGYQSFEFDADERRVVSDIATRPPSTVMARLDSNLLSTTGEVLDVSNTFEVFMDESDQCDAITSDSSADRLTNDYTLRLKLQDFDENQFEKDLYVTASKYYLSDSEYDARIAAGLSTLGYFKKDTLQYMNEFRLHGYAGVIPDLSMRDYRIINTRVVSPDDETLVTEEQFRKNFENQGYSQEQIDDAVRVFLNNGGQFLVMDLRQYDNKFISLDEIGICVSQLDSYDSPYWVNNLNGFFNFVSLSAPDRPIEPTVARGDSFTIAPSGLDPSVLESYGNQVLASEDPGLDKTSNTGHEIAIVLSAFATKIITAVDSGISGFKLRLRKSSYDGEFTNSPGAGLRASLYSSVDGLPGNLIATGGTVTFDSISDIDFTEKEFFLNHNFAQSRVYWLAVEPTEAMPWGFVAVESKTEPVTLTAWHYDAGRDTPDWTPVSGTIWLSGYNGETETIAPVFNQEDGYYEEVLCYDKTAIKITVPSDTDRIGVLLSAILQEENPYGTLLNGTGKRVRMRIVTSVADFPSGVEVTTATGPEMRSITDSMVEYKFETEDTLSAGTYWAEFYFDETPRGGWVFVPKDTSDVTNGYMAHRHPDDTWIAHSSDVWLDCYQQTYAILGAFNRDTPNITEHLPPPNDQRRYTAVNTKSNVYKVDTFWSYTSRQLEEPSELSIYPRAFYNPNTASWEYAPRSRDIFVKVKLWVDGRVVEKDIIHLESAPGWRAQFWAKTSGDEKDLDITDESTTDVIVESINYENYEGDDDELGQSWNARFEGNFRPLYDDEVYTLVLEANTGARVYFEDMDTPVIDTWDSPSYVPVSYVIPGPLDQSNTYTIVVEHYRDTTTQKLKLFWYSTTNPIPELISPDTSYAVAPTAVTLGPELADGIAYLAVAKTQEELETYTDGAPPGDVIVIRSS
jgi:hypothetical protein